MTCLLPFELMAPLFGKNLEKQAQIEATREAIERLCSVPPEEFALELMPVFGPDGPKASVSNGGLNIMQIGIGLLNGYPQSAGYLKQLEQPLREGLQVLEHADLVLRTTRRTGTWFSPTRLGETALADGTVQQKIKTRE